MMRENKAKPNPNFNLTARLESVFVAKSGRPRASKLAVDFTGQLFAFSFLK